MLPKILAIMLIILSFIPMGMPGISYFVPMIDIMIIFYWSIYHPKLLPQWFVLIMGILSDILFGQPIGMTSLSNLIFREITVSRRRFLIKEPFMTVWLNFALFSFGIACMRWMIASFIFHRFFSIDAAAVQWVLTASLYAWMHWLLGKVYVLLPVSYAK